MQRKPPIRQILPFELTRYHIILFIGISLLFISAVLVLIMGLTVIQDFSQDAGYRKTKCTVRGFEFNDMNPKNEWTRCPWTCTIQHTPDGLKTFCELSEFPCLKIIVDVQTKNGLKSAVLYENPDQIMKYPDCSTFHCNRDSVVNDKMIKKFKRTWGNIGSTYSCYYNMKSLDAEDDDDDQEHALLRLSYSQASYVNAIFWPCFLAFAGIITIIYGLIVRSKLRKNNIDGRGLYEKPINTQIN